MRSVSPAVLVLALAACPSPPSAPASAPVVREPVARVEREPVPSLPSAAMIETMVSHAVLTHPRVVPFLHLEISANVPLRVFAGPDLAAGAPALHAAGQPVRIVSEADARVVLASRERLDGSTVRVRFRIPPEGVAGHVDVGLRDNAWTAVAAEVAER